MLDDLTGAEAVLRPSPHCLAHRAHHHFEPAPTTDTSTATVVTDADAASVRCIH